MGGVGAEPSPTLRFADAARRLGAAARAAGLAAPAFRSPPRIAGVRRSIRRYPGGAVVSVRLRGQPFSQVAADMIDGVVIANRLRGEPAERVRAALAQVLAPPAGPGDGTSDPAGAGARPPTLSPGARVAERQTQAA